MRRLLACLILLLMAAASTGADGVKLRRPRLDVRATPRVAVSPAYVLLTAELVGGDEVEDYYCPGLEWNWGDGARSVRESDCPPFEPGLELERRFTAEHGYRHAGEYEITITLRRANRPVAVASARVNVRPGLGDLSAP